uniref:STAS domain-containing protein n=1 Tax=Nonomuraea pusilla TaxID=46177 RepID=UPI0006E1DA5E|nr:STAS domain-containing protein [Nonomuraea pusilla]
MPLLDLSFEQLPGVTVIAITGEMDATNRGQLESYLEERGPDLREQVVFDLAGVPFMDSSGLHVLLACAAACDERGGAARLAAVQSLPARLLEITEVVAYVPVHPTVADAVTAASAVARNMTAPAPD